MPPLKSVESTKWSTVESKPAVRITTRLLDDNHPLIKELKRETFTKLSANEQIAELWRLMVKFGPKDPKTASEVIEIVTAAFASTVSHCALTAEEVEHIDTLEYAVMSPLSKKKVAVVRYRRVLGEYYDQLSEDTQVVMQESGIDREKFIRTSLKKTLESFQGVSNEITDYLWSNYNLGFEARWFIRVFNSEDSIWEDTIADVCATSGGNPDHFVDLAVEQPFLGIDGNKIKRELADTISTDDRLTGNFLAQPVSLVEGSHLEGVDIERVNSNGFINPNWFLYDVDAVTAMKLWGEQKTKYLFGNYFLSHLRSVEGLSNVQYPDFYNLCQFRLKASESINDDKPKLTDMLQHVFEWTLPSDFTSKMLAELVSHLRTVVPDFLVSGQPKNFEHPVQTSLGRKSYAGYFAGSKGFENTSLIDIRSQDPKWVRKLRFSTDYGQDAVLFVILQVSHFLKHKSFIREDHLWTSIYRLYNNMSMEGVSRFDPKVFEEQYNTLVKKVIWPLSLEHIREKWSVGKPHNILLYGLYGTGKSQLLTHVLAERRYTLPNGKDITLNANVLNIGVSEFADMLVKSVSGFRKRLSDIHENTGLPIILIVEDIDTIIKEVGTESDPVSQALTTFFEGVGSLPVTVITSTNSPERLPERHLRPNRLDVLSAFNYPIEKDALKGVLHTHWTRANLEKTWNSRVNFDAFSEHVLPKIGNFTASHVAAFIKTLIEELEFEDNTSLDKTSIFAIVDRSLEMVIVPIGDMTVRQESMQRWHANLTSRNSKKIGF